MYKVYMVGTEDARRLVITTSDIEGLFLFQAGGAAAYVACRAFCLGVLVNIHGVKFINTTEEFGG